MPQPIKADLKGVREAVARLDKLKRGVRGKILRKGLSEADKKLLAATKANMPTLTGLAKKSLGRKEKVYRESGVGVGLVGPRKGFKQVVTLALVGKRKPKVRGAVQGTKKSAGLIGAYAAGRASAFVTRKVDPVKYFHLIEGGRKAVRPTKKKALSTGLQVFARARAAAGKHPLERALSSQGGAAGEAFRSAVADGIAKEMA